MPPGDDPPPDDKEHPPDSIPKGEDSENEKNSDKKAEQEKEEQLYQGRYNLHLRRGGKVLDNYFDEDAFAHVSLFIMGQVLLKQGSKTPQRIMGGSPVITHVPNAYLHDDNDKLVHMILRRLAELMDLIMPKIYQKHISIDDKGTPVLYVRVTKAPYKMLCRDLFYSKKLIKDLLFQGFKLNPYDTCIANKVINRNQTTIAFHVND